MIQDCIKTLKLSHFNRPCYYPKQVQIEDFLEKLAEFKSFFVALNM